jgi:hypothetical protein
MAHPFLGGKPCKTHSPPPAAGAFAGSVIEIASVILIGTRRVARPAGVAHATERA